MTPCRLDGRARLGPLWLTEIAARGAQTPSNYTLERGSSVLYDVLVNGNMARQGAGVHVQNSDVLFVGGSFGNNTAARRGGAVFSNSSNVTMQVWDPLRRAFPRFSPAGMANFSRNVAGRAGAGLFASSLPNGSAAPCNGSEAFAVIAADNSAPHGPTCATPPASIRGLLDPNATTPVPLGQHFHMFVDVVRVGRARVHICVSNVAPCAVR